MLVPPKSMPMATGWVIENAHEERWGMKIGRGEMTNDESSKGSITQE